MNAREVATPRFGMSHQVYSPAAGKWIHMGWVSSEQVNSDENVNRDDTKGDTQQSLTSVGAYVNGVWEHSSRSSILAAQLDAKRESMGVSLGDAVHAECVVGAYAVRPNVMELRDLFAEQGYEYNGSLAVYAMCVYRIMNQ